MFGHVRAYFGVVEPQMRKALHLHMLIQLAGFSHPQDLFGTDVLPNTFKRFFWFVASISFRSTEAFASYTNEDAAKAKLASMPLLPLSKKQRGMIGEARVRESLNAQKVARGISEATGFPISHLRTYILHQKFILTKLFLEGHGRHLPQRK